MGMSTDHAVALLKHYFHNDPIADVGDAVGLRGSTTAGSVFVALHTAAPSGAQDDNECEDGDYVRKPVNRTLAKWTLTDTPVDGKVFVVNADDITFEAIADEDVPSSTHASIGAEVSGETLRLFSSALAAPLAMVVGEIPKIVAGALRIEIAVDDAS